MKKDSTTTRTPRTCCLIVSWSYYYYYVLLIFVVASSTTSTHGWVITTTTCNQPSSLSSTPRTRSTKSMAVMMMAATAVPEYESSSSSSNTNNNNIVIGIESTPNPSSFLIHLSTPLQGLEDIVGTLKGKTFSTATSTTTSSGVICPLEISTILQIDGIESVYALATALTINKHVSAKWEIILPLIMNALGVVEGAATDEQLILQGLLLSSSSSTAATATSSPSPSSSSSGSGQVRIRMQISNNIPIQIEGIGFLGTIKRIQLPPLFQESMELLLMETNDKIDFFGGRQWIDRGIRYLEEEDEDEEGDATSSILPPSEIEIEQRKLELALQSELDEVVATYSKERLMGIVEKSRNKNNSSKEKKKTSSSSPASSSGVTSQSSATTTTTTTEVLNNELDLESVDRFCDLAEQGDKKALITLCNFLISNRNNNKKGSSSMAARRNALAYLGTTGGGSGSVKDVVLDAIVSSFQKEKNPTIRRTAGDALSDLGDKKAIPYAMTALLEDKSKLVQWRAARILGELGDSIDVMAGLKQASFTDNYAFEVAFEIKDAMRKVKSRMQVDNNNDNNNNDGTTTVKSGRSKTGPIWKQIQEGTTGNKKGSR